MEFTAAIETIVQEGIPTAARRFGSALNAEWVDEALKHTDTLSVRRRWLPARLVVWLVIHLHGPVQGLRHPDSGDALGAGKPMGQRSPYAVGRVPSSQAP